MHILRQYICRNMQKNRKCRNVGSEQFPMLAQNRTRRVSRRTAERSETGRVGIRAERVNRAPEPLATWQKTSTPISCERRTFPRSKCPRHQPFLPQALPGLDALVGREAVGDRPLDEVVADGLTDAGKSRKSSFSLPLLFTLPFTLIFTLLFTLPDDTSSSFNSMVVRSGS